MEIEPDRLFCLKLHWSSLIQHKVRPWLYQITASSVLMINKLTMEIPRASSSVPWFPLNRSVVAVSIPAFQSIRPACFGVSSLELALKSDIRCSRHVLHSVFIN